jgi:hypothetical protein
MSTMPFRKAIAYLRDMPVPGTSGFRFNGAFTVDGDVVHIQVIRDSDGKSVGTAVGERADRVIQDAQGIARLHPAA